MKEQSGTVNSQPVIRYDKALYSLAGAPDWEIEEWQPLGDTT